MRNIQQNNFSNQLEKIIPLMPGNVYWKNREGVYLGCNQNTTNLVRCSSSNCIIGNSIHDVFEKKFAERIADEDETIMINNKESILEEIGFDLKYQPAIYLSKKIPTHNFKGEVIGLFGISIDITHQKNIQFVETTLNKFSNYVIEQKYKTLPTLAKRELECLYFIIRGMTAKQIGKALNLSFRTVESYIENMKYKFNCNNRSELIGKAIDLGYIHLTVKNPHNFKFDPHLYSFLEY